MNRVLVFVDEIKHSEASSWAYVGLVSIPQSRIGGALDRLLAERNRVGYHRELHYSDLKRRGEKVELAKAWLNLLMEDPQTWHFGIVGFDMSRLCLSAFGERNGEQFANSYRRFLRSALAFHLKTAHCRKGPAEVVAIYHDRNGQLEADPYFDWHAIRWLGVREDKLSFRRDRIIFVDSNHLAAEGHPKASHFIQLVDVLLGATRHVIERPTSNRGKDEVAQHFLPLVERLNHRQDWCNPNGRYRHYPRCQLSYFPRRQLTPADLHDLAARVSSGFYRGRVLRLTQMRSGQLPLDLDSGGSEAERNALEVSGTGDPD